MSGAEILFAVLQPSNSILLVIVAGALLAAMRRRAGAWLLGTGIVLLGVVGLLPVGAALLRPLEAATTIPALDEPPDAIIVLGGFLDGKPGGPVPLDLDEAADRLTAAASLARRFPGVPLVVTDGGETAEEPAGGALAADWLESAGVPRERLVVEPRATSTWENAVLTAELLPPRPDGRYLLVTSAWHMPRSLAIFRRAGWPELIPYPVDRRSGTDQLAWPRSVAGGLAAADLAAREWVAVGWYAVTGRLAGFRL